MMSRAAHDGSFEPRERVRLVEVEASSEAPARTRVRVTLEWHSERFRGEQVGESAPALVLRASANAALEALRRVAPDAPLVRLVGIKQIRAFDTDVLVVALTTATPPQQFVGAVLVGDAPVHAAAAAVLHALNRVLGNYLAVK